ncbi:MAG TPA: RibD family protein [bacterium]|nr:RibD family protein [bacterium]
MSAEPASVELDAARVRARLAASTRPYVSLKAAMTLDGKIANRDGQSRWITGAPARRLGHQLRALHQGLLVGIGTVLADDPQLTVRLPDEVRSQPARIVLDSRCRISLDARCLAPDGVRRIVVTGRQAPDERVRALRGAGVEVVQCNEDQPHPQRFLPRLRALGLDTVLAEGGARVHASLIAQEAADELFLFVAGKVMGDSAAPVWCADAAVGVELARLPCVRLLPPVWVEGDILIRGTFGAP